PRELVPGEPQLVLDGLVRGAANIQRGSSGYGALHVVNYDYDLAREATVPASAIRVQLRPPFEVGSARVHRPGLVEEVVPVETRDGAIHLELPEVGPYAIVEFA
ncbi:MAG: hypothetical protein WCA32_19755, partial [Chromatiaceae bacterium]